MKVLIVYSRNTAEDSTQYVFINDQVDALLSLGIIVDYFGISGNGVFGYLKNRRKLVEKIKSYNPDVIHAHYGLSGLLANLQYQVPVVTTYHGSDIHNAKVFPFSRLCMMLSAHNIFVSEKTRMKSGLKRKSSMIPCGVDVNLFYPMDKQQSRKSFGLNIDKKIVLFSGSFHNAVKNASLAKEAVALLPNVELLELKGYSREQVVLLMNAVDVALMTSFSEGSPQFIKEAMACNCPIVSVPVGDVPEILKNGVGCFISTFNSNDVAEKLQKAMNFDKPTNGRELILALKLDNETIAKRIYEIYSKILNSINK